MQATTHPLDWEDRIRKLCLAYNSSVQATTGHTPFLLMYGRLPADVMFSTDKPDEMSHNEYAARLCSILEEAYNTVREMTAMKQERQKQLYDQRTYEKPYAVGDKVWLHSTAVP